MNQRERNWTLGPFTMWRRDWDDRLGLPIAASSPLKKRKLDGATITDEGRGLIYQAVIEQADGRARLTGITILTTRPGQRIDQETIRRIPVQRIAEQVALHLAAAAGLPSFTTKPHQPEGPSLKTADVAQDYKDGLSRRAIADKRYASVYTVDKRLREARDLGLIGRAATGRPRAPENSGINPDETITTKRMRGRE